MSESSWLRSVIRVGFFTILILISAILLGVITLKANAATTQTSDGFAGTSNQRPIPLAPDSIVLEEDLLQNMSLEVSNRLQAQGQFIYERDQESQELDDKLTVSQGHTVALVSDQKMDRNGVMEEYIRTHPADRVYSLNLKAFSLLSEQDASRKLKEIILALEDRNVHANGDHRVILFIKDLPSLQHGTFVAPIDALWEQIIRGARLNFVISTDPGTFTAQTSPAKSKYQNLSGLIERQDVLPPSFDAVLNYLLENRGILEANGRAPISSLAFEEAARIGVRFYNQSSFQSAFALLQAAQKQVAAGQRVGADETARLQLELKKLTQQAKVLSDDYNAGTDEEKAALTPRMAEVGEKLIDVNAQLSGKDEHQGLSKQVAGLELKILNLEHQLEVERQNKSKLDFGRSGRISNLEAQIERNTTGKLELEYDLLDEKTSNVVTRVGIAQVHRVASRWTKLPVERLTADFDRAIREFDDLKKIIINQDHVIDAIKKSLLIVQTHINDGPNLTPEQVAAVKRGEMSDTDRPLGVYIFSGATGVGKTETAIQLAKKMGRKLVRFDMSEFSEKHTVSRLIGAPPGYIGYDVPGELVDAVAKDPNCILLLDEIEKAHPDIMNTFLQVMDAGRLTDGQGRTIDFRRVLMVMTTNLEQDVATWDRNRAIHFLKTQADPVLTDQQIAQRTGYDENKLRNEVWKEKITNPKVSSSNYTLRKEFVNRSTPIMFNNLAQKDQLEIARNTMDKFVKRVKAFHDIDLRFTPTMVMKLMDYFNEKEGGRSVRRAFDDLFRANVAEMIFYDKIPAGSGTVIMDLNERDNQITFQGTTLEALAQAERESMSSTPEQGKLKETLLARAKQEPQLREARAATGDLVRRVFDDEWMISERTMARLIRR